MTYSATAQANGSPEPHVPHEVMGSWQRIVDICSEMTDVHAGLVMRTEAPDHFVLVSSKNTKNPYEIGKKFTLHPNLYCYGVMENDGELVVENAANDDRWAENDDLDYGMNFYVGYPLKWPNGEFFGTICLLDTARNEKALKFRACMQEFARMIETDLALLHDIEARLATEKLLQETLESLEKRVKRRTSELQDANNAMRLLLSNMEAAELEYELKIADQLENTIYPYLAELRGGFHKDSMVVTLIDEIQQKLKSMTTEISAKLELFEKKLSPIEQEIAHMVMRGKTSKDISVALAREPSTIEFHRTNIRKKLGFGKSKENLCSLLWSL